MCEKRDYFIWEQEGRGKQEREGGFIGSREGMERRVVGNCESRRMRREQWRGSKEGRSNKRKEGNEGKARVSKKQSTHLVLTALILHGHRDAAWDVR